MKRNAATVLFLLLTVRPAAAAGLPDPAPFDAVLAARAKNGGFDYRGVTGQDRKRLGAYVANLGDARTAEMTDDEKKAFYINAYNAIAIGTLLGNPGRKIIDVPGAFNDKEWRVGGEMLTLDDIEKIKLKPMGDPRYHFAIVCASKSCPPLAPRAYTAEGLSAALDRQARAFVNDRSKNVVDRAGDRIALSKVFDWNRQEFERGSGSVTRYVARFVKDPAAASWLSTISGPVTFLEYDWEPNQP